MRIAISASIVLGAGGLLACAGDARDPDLVLTAGDRDLAVWISEQEAHFVDGKLALRYRLQTEDLDDVVVEADLDAEGRGTLIMTSTGLRHEVKLDDKLFLVTYERGTQGREVGFYARPRGDMLSVLARRSAALDDGADRMLPNMPLHYVLLHSLDRLSHDGVIDRRVEQLVRASDMLLYRYDFDPSIAPATIRYADAWDQAVTQQSLAGLVDDALPGAAARAEPGQCPVLQPVSGSASIASASTSAGGVLDVNCAAASVNIGALAPAGSGFATTSSGVTLSHNQTSVACPSDCNNGEWSGECFSATITGNGNASVTPGAGFIGDGAADTANGPKCTIKSSSPINLDITVSANDVSNNATGGQATVSLSASATWDEDPIWNDLCSASGSGSASASLSGGGQPPTCTPTPVPTTTTTTTTAETVTLVPTPVHVDAESTDID